MGGLVKGIKKVFKAVGHVISKIWKPLLIAAAIYFTAGIALAYFAPTAGFAAALPGFGAGGIFSSTATAIGIGSAESVAAGTGLAGLAGGAAAGAAGAAAAGAAGAEVAGSLGADAAAVGAGAMAPGAAVAADLGLPAAGGAAAAGDLGGAGVMLAGTSAADLTAATGTAVGADASAAAAGVAPAVATPTGSTFLGPTTQSTSAVTKVGSVADKGFWGGMSSAEKAQLAATTFQAISGLLQPGPTRAQQGLWPGGAYFGVDEKGQGTDLGTVYNNEMTGANKPTAASGIAPTAPGSTAPLAAGGAAATPASPTQPTGQPTAAASAQTGSSFLPTSGSGAATAQQTTAQQQSQMEETNQSNADFIRSTMANLDPRKRGG